MSPQDNNPSDKKSSGNSRFAQSFLLNLLAHSGGALTGMPIGVSTEALPGLYTLLTERLYEAKDEYEARSADRADTFEEKRLIYLDNLSALQTEVMLTVAESALRQNIMVALVEQTTDTYEADSNAELDSVNRRTKLVETWLERYRNHRSSQRRYRVWAVAISIIAFVLLFAGAIFGSRWGLGADYVIPTLLIPLPVLMWSAIGSITSLLYRFNLSADAELQNPLRLLVTRPLTGIMMGIIVYLVLKAGFLTAVPEQSISLANNELVWLLAFLAGFSDRFSDGLLKSVVGRLGENQEQGLFTPVDPVQDPNLLTELRTYLDRRLGQKSPTSEQAGSDTTDSGKKAPPIDTGQSATDSAAGHNGKSAHETLNDNIDDSANHDKH